MAEPMIPAGAFAAMKAGQPLPSAAPKAEAKAPLAAAPEPKPKTELRKPASEVRKEPEVVRKQAPQLRNADNDDEPDAAPAAMTAAERKIWKLKVDGEEFDFDATDEESVKREIMKARGADKRFDSAASLRREAEQAFSMLKDPAQLRKILEDPRVGIDVKKFAEEMVWEDIQRREREAEWAKDPAAKQRWEDEQELKSRRETEARERELGETKAKREAVTHFEVSYEAKIQKALAIGGIPQTVAAVQRMAEYLHKSVEEGLDLSPEELVQEVRADYMNDLTSVLSAADGEQLLALLGEANAEKLRQADLKRLKNPQGNPFTARSAAKKAASGKSDPAPKRMGGSDWREALKNEFLNRNR